MAQIDAIPVPPGSLLAEFGPAKAYRDCFARTVPSQVSLAEFVERFYCSAAFRPERIVLGLIGKGASNADARAVARGEAESFAAWNVVERRTASGLVAEHGPAGSARATARPQAREGRGNRGADALRKTKTQAADHPAYRSPEILLRDFRGSTASWLSVQPGESGREGSTTLLFGSWVGQPDRGIVKALMPFHRWYSRVLLGGVRIA